MYLLFYLHVIGGIILILGGITAITLKEKSQFRVAFSSAIIALILFFIRFILFGPI
jgi:hypothetical protein